jgi:hypothetical protein
MLTKASPASSRWNSQVQIASKQRHPLPSVQLSPSHWHAYIKVLSTQTGVLALFKMPSSQKHPVTNCQSQQLEHKKPRETTTKHHRK